MCECVCVTVTSHKSLMKCVKLCPNCLDVLALDMSNHNFMIFLELVFFHLYFFLRERYWRIGVINYRFF
jgi:hypothetical protein